jgi:hypothetical protein
VWVGVGVGMCGWVWVWVGGWVFCVVEKSFFEYIKLTTQDTNVCVYIYICVCVYIYILAEVPGVARDQM